MKLLLIQPEKHTRSRKVTKRAQEESLRERRNHLSRMSTWSSVSPRGRERLSKTNPSQEDL